MGLNYSWVSFDGGSVLDAGGAASGEFSIFFDGVDADTRFYVRGRFDVASIAKDKFTATFLPEVENLLPDSRDPCEGEVTAR